MSVITISRGSYTHGSVVAEKVSKKLGYACISREILLEIADEYNIPEIKLLRSIRDAPSISERYTFAREKYINFIRAAFLAHVIKDNVVYHGFAGQYFLKDAPHVLKVRIIANMKYRIECMMQREAVSEKKAEQMVKEVDEERRKWSQKLYDLDTWDSRLYDLVINIEKISIDQASEMICNTVKLSPFQTTPESQKTIERLKKEAMEKLEKGPKQSPFFEPLRESPWKKNK
jgi:cytidylate kinase